MNRFFIMLIAYALILHGCTQPKDSLEQLREDLENRINESENIIDLSRIELNVKPANLNPKSDFDENDYRNFYTPIEKYVSVDEFIAFTKRDFYIKTEIRKPKNFVSIESVDFDVYSILGIDTPYSDLPQFKPTLLNFWDGTSTANFTYKTEDISKITDEDLRDENELNYNEFLINSSKPIKSIDFDIKFKHKSFIAYRLDKKTNKVKVADGWIEMISNDAGEVKISYPKSLSKKMGETFGVYKNGKILRRSGSTSFTFSSAETINWLKKALPIYKKAIELIDEKTLKTAQEVNAYLAKKLTKKPIETQQLEFTKYYFSGPVDHLMLHVQNDKPEHVTKKVTINLYKDFEKIDEEGYYVAVDEATKLSGIVDKAGNWIINPSYKKIVALGEKSFRVYEKGVGTPKTLDVKNKKLI